MAPNVNLCYTVRSGLTQADVKTGGILCNLANRASSCDRRRNSQVEQSREMYMFC